MRGNGGGGGEGKWVERNWVCNSNQIGTRLSSYISWLKLRCFVELRGERVSLIDNPCLNLACAMSMPFAGLFINSQRECLFPLGKRRPGAGSWPNRFENQQSSDVALHPNLYPFHVASSPFFLLPLTRNEGSTPLASYLSSHLGIRNEVGCLARRFTLLFRFHSSEIP